MAIYLIFNMYYQYFVLLRDQEVAGSNPVAPTTFPLAECWSDNPMQTGYFHAFILRSESEHPHFYTGFTENLEARLAHQNSGGAPHTATYRP